MALYLVDSNFFIQAHRYTYPLDIATGFWNKVEELAKTGIIASIDKVKNEIYDKNDELEAWCKAHLPADFFKDTSEVIDQYKKLTTWALSMSEQYLPNAINEFLDANEADAFLVAYAMFDLKNRVIVTQEVSQPGRKNKIKIPQPCNVFNIKYMNTIEMFREIGVTF